MNLCECGCGTLVKRKWVIGHNNKGKVMTKETKEKISNSLKGIERSDEYKKNMSKVCTGIKKTEDHKKNLSKAHMGKKLSDEHKKSIGESCKGLLVGSKNPMFGKSHSPETIEKIREANLGENNYGWKGGKDTYLHQKAWEKFGVEYCEHCGITLLEYKQNNKCRLEMHCTSNPKDYTILEKSNWMCLCKKCHKKEEKLEK